MKASCKQTRQPSFFIPPNVRNQEGSVPVELAVSLMLFLFIAFGVIEYGSMINERNVLTQLAREGASLASRQLTTDANMLDLLESTDNALDFKGNPDKYRIFLAQATAGLAPNAPPQCTVVERGSLNASEVESPGDDPQCGLTGALWNYLTFDPGIGTAPVQQFTVVKVYYKHEAITPLGDIDWYGGGGSSDGTVMFSQAIF